ncbi:hypothetical protein P9112_006773 [Eukaryota sp. TZLM1-RC]
MWLTQSQFWSLCFDFVCQSEPKQRRPFENHPLVYQALQHLVQHFWAWRPLNETTLADGGRFWCLSTLLGSRAIQLREAFCQLLADGPVVWKRNFFKSCVQFLNCPWPKKYADCVLQGIQPDESILQWPSKAELEPRRASGNYVFHNSERKRKSIVHRTANPQRRPRLPVEQQPNYRDPDENLFFVAIDPNYSNLCGWTAGSFRNSAPVFERSGLLLNPKERRLNHPPPLTQATPDTYSAQSFQEYLIEISLPYVLESEEEPEYSSIMSGNMQRGARKKLRRNKFDFFIIRQKRITSFINKI